VAHHGRRRWALFFRRGARCGDRPSDPGPDNPRRTAILRYASWADPNCLKANRIKPASYLCDRSISVLVDENRMQLVARACVIVNWLDPRLPTQFSSLDLGSSPLVQVDWGV